MSVHDLFRLFVIRCKLICGLTGLMLSLVGFILYLRWRKS